MKSCTKCLIAKEEKEFFVKDKKTGRLHTQCKACYKDHRKNYFTEHYAKYGDAYRKRAKLRRAILKRQNQEKLISYMQDKFCKDCGESDIRVLEFDHIEPSEKLFGIARAVSEGKPWQIILDEIGKCQILCANCHKKRTATQYGWFKAQGLE